MTGPFLLSISVFIFSFFISLFCLVPCGRLSWLFASFWAHVNILHRSFVRSSERTCRYTCVYNVNVFNVFSDSDYHGHARIRANTRVIVRSVNAPLCSTTSLLLLTQHGAFEPTFHIHKLRVVHKERAAERHRHARIYRVIR